MRKEDAVLMTAEEIARYNESLLCVPGEAARLWDSKSPESTSKGGSGDER